MASNHSIYTLSLAGCPLRDEGAMALAEALKTNISLYKLDLSNCLVSSRLPGREHITKADVTSWHIGSKHLVWATVQAAPALCNNIVNNWPKLNLALLDGMSCCRLCFLQVGPEGAIALAAALKVNPVLAYLNLSGTSIGEAFGVMINPAVFALPVQCCSHTPGVWLRHPH
jgi:hypothetical protein